MATSSSETALAVGGHTMTAVYVGTANFAGSLSSSFIQFITPNVTSISPRFAPTAGGTLVEIDGVGLGDATAVTFGSSPAAFTVVSDSVIDAIAPVHAAA